MPPKKLKTKLPSREIVLEDESTPKTTDLSLTQEVDETVSSGRIKKTKIKTKTKTKTKSKKSSASESVDTLVSSSSISIPIPTTLTVMLGSEVFNVEEMGNTSQNQGVIVCANIDHTKSGQYTAKIIQTLVEPRGKNLVVFFYKSNYDILKIYKTWNETSAVSKLRNYLYQNLFKSLHQDMISLIETAGYSAGDKDIQMIIIDREYLNNVDIASPGTFLTKSDSCYNLFGNKNGFLEIELRNNKDLLSAAKNALVTVTDSSIKKGGKTRRRKNKNIK